MTGGATQITTTNLIGASAEAFQAGGYRDVDPSRVVGWPAASARIFEDEFGIVAAVAFETWSDLVDNWQDVQSAFVDLITENLSQGIPKAWEGFLILMTPSPVPVTERDLATSIRVDLHRVRKLLITGDELGGLGSVRRTVLSLLPFDIPHSMTDSDSTLEMLPSLLQGSGVPVEETEAVVAAFLRGESLLENLQQVIEER